MDVVTQKENLIAWANGVLQKRGLMMDSEKDLRDGVLFYHLIELLSGKNMPNCVTASTTQVQSLINLFYVLSFLADQGVQLSQDSCCAQEIAKGNGDHAVYLLERMATHYQKEEATNGETSGDYVNGKGKRHAGMDDFHIDYGTHTQYFEGLRGRSNPGSDGSVPGGPKTSDVSRDRRVSSVSSPSSDGPPVVRPAITPLSRRQEIISGRKEKRLSMPQLTLAMSKGGGLAVQHNYDLAHSPTFGNADPQLVPSRADGATAIELTVPAHESEATSTQDHTNGVLEDNVLATSTSDNHLITDRGLGNETSSPEDFNMPPEENPSAVRSGPAHSSLVDSTTALKRLSNDAADRTGKEFLDGKVDEPILQGNGTAIPEENQAVATNLSNSRDLVPETTDTVEHESHEALTPRINKKPKSKRPKSKSKGEDVTLANNSREEAENHTSSQKGRKKENGDSARDGALTGVEESHLSADKEELEKNNIRKPKKREGEKRKKKKGKKIHGERAIGSGGTTEGGQSNQNKNDNETTRELSKGREGGKEITTQPAPVTDANTSTSYPESPQTTPRKRKIVSSQGEVRGEEEGENELLDMWDFLKSTPPPPSRNREDESPLRKGKLTRAAILPLLKKLSPVSARDARRRKGSGGSSASPSSTPSGSLQEHIISNKKKNEHARNSRDKKPQIPAEPEETEASTRTRAHTAAARLTRHSSPALAFPEDGAGRERSATYNGGKKDTKDAKVVSEGDLTGTLLALQPPPPLGYSSLSTISVTAQEGPILEEISEAGAINNDLTLFEFVQLLEKEHGFAEEVVENKVSGKHSIKIKKMAQKVNSMLMKNKQTSTETNLGHGEEESQGKGESTTLPSTSLTPGSTADASNSTELGVTSGETEEPNQHTSRPMSPRRPLLTEVAWASIHEGMLDLFSPATGWVCRYFALKGDVLRYYESSPSKTKGLPCLGSILLFNAVLEISSAINSQYGREHCLGILGEGKEEEDKVVLSAPSAQTLEEWIDVLQRCNITGIYRE